MAKSLTRLISDLHPSNLTKYLSDLEAFNEWKARIVRAGYKDAMDLSQADLKRTAPTAPSLPDGIPDTGVLSKNTSPFAEDSVPTPTKSVLGVKDVTGRLTRDKADSAQNLMDIKSIKRGPRSTLKEKTGPKKQEPEAPALKEDSTAREARIQDIMSRVKSGTYSTKPYAESVSEDVTGALGRMELDDAAPIPETSTVVKAAPVIRKKGASLGVDEAVMKPLKPDAAQQELDDVIAELDKATPDAAVMKPTKGTAPIEPAPAAAPPVDVPATKEAPTIPEQQGIPDPALSQLRPKGMPMPTSTIPETGLVPYTGVLKEAPATPPAQLQLPAESATTAQDWAQLGRQTNPLDINWGDKIGSSSPEAIPLPVRSASSMQQDWAQLGRNTDPSTVKFDTPVGGPREQLSNMLTRRVPAKGEVAEAPTVAAPTQIPPKSNLLRNSLLGAGVFGAAGTGGALLSSYGAERPTVTPAFGGSSTTPQADTNTLGILGVPPGSESSQQGMTFGDKRAANTSRGMAVGGGRVEPNLNVEGTAIPIDIEGKNLGLDDKSIKGFESIKSMPPEVKDPLMDRLAALNSEARQIQADLAAKIDASQNQYEANSNKVALAEFGANLAQSLAKIGAAIYGLKNNMNISSHLKMDPISLNRQMDRVFQEHQMRMSRYTDAAKVASADIKEERQGVQEEIIADKKAKAAAVAADIKMKIDAQIKKDDQAFIRETERIKNDASLTLVQQEAALKDAGDERERQFRAREADKDRFLRASNNAAAGKPDFNAALQYQLMQKAEADNTASQGNQDKLAGELDGAVAALQTASGKDATKLMQTAVQAMTALNIPDAEKQAFIASGGKGPGWFSKLMGAKELPTKFTIPPPPIKPVPKFKDGKLVPNSPAQQGVSEKSTQPAPKPDGFYDEEQDGKVYRVKYQGGKRVGVTAK
jgi:hypothetical protein